MRWPASIKLALGLWMVAAPWVLRHGHGVAATEEMTLGLLLCAFAIWSAVTRLSIIIPAWATFGLGIWSVLAPWMLGYNLVTAARMNDVLVGFGTVMFSVVQIGLRWPAGGRPASGS